MSLNRRDFIGSVAFVTAAGLVRRANAMLPNEQRAFDAYAAASVTAPEGLLASEPVLQVPSPDSMGVSFAVKFGVQANGFAEVADNPEMRGAVRHFCEGFPQGGIGDVALKIRMTGLRPATRYYYRVGACVFEPVKRSWAKPSEIVWGQVHSFATPGEAAASSFAVINDTHANYRMFAAATERVKKLGSPIMVWNGDCPGDHVDEVSQLVSVYLKPPMGEGYATDIPVLLNRGNHDYRGRAAHQLGEVMMTRSYTERSVRDQPLDRNFAIRQGDIALIGLETGEDKPDRHPANGGYGRFEVFRSMQTLWLKDQFRRPEIAKAPYVVVFCHIPLFDPNPRANPGTIMEDYAEWQGQCAAEWGPILAANGVQVVIAGHTHTFRYDAPTKSRTWAQIVGGGPECNDREFPTVISANVKDGRLAIEAFDVFHRQLVGQWSFAQRGFQGP